MKIGNVKWRLLILLVALAFALRVWGVGKVAHFAGDEGEQVPAAKSFVERGVSNATFWHHPPLGMYLIDGGIRVFGDNPYGWRAKNLVLGTITVAIVFLLALELFGDPRVAFITGLLLALDPLHILLSRATFDEITAAFFFLAAVHVSVRYLKGCNETPVAAGILLGCSLASKLYYLAGGVALLAFVVVYTIKQDRFSCGRLLHLLLVFLVLPVTVFVLTYLPWFGRGYDIAEFLRFQVDCLRDIRAMTLQWFANDLILRESGLPWEWFLRPKLFGLQFAGTGDRGSYLVFMNNPLVWLLVCPALVYSTRRLLHRGELLLLPLLLLAAGYVPLLLLKRPIFLYSAITVIPFAFMLMAYAAVALAERYRLSRRAYAAALVVLLLWSAYLYPLATRRSVPTSLYGPILSHAKLFRAY